MPTLQVTTKRSNEVWKSPDGQRVLHEVSLDYNGQSVTAKTYSRAIASEGFSGEVETYSREGKNGTETFVKQVQREGGYQSDRGGNRSPRDDSAIKAQMAIKAAIHIGGVVDVTKQDTMAIHLAGIENAAKEIFAMVDRVKDSTTAHTDKDDPLLGGDTISIEDIPFNY